MYSKLALLLMLVTACLALRLDHEFLSSSETRSEADEALSVDQNSFYVLRCSVHVERTQEHCLQRPQYGDGCVQYDCPRQSSQFYSVRLSRLCFGGSQCLCSLFPSDNGESFHEEDQLKVRNQVGYSSRSLMWIDFHEEMETGHIFSCPPPPK